MRVFVVVLICLGITALLFWQLRPAIQRSVAPRGVYPDVRPDVRHAGRTLQEVVTEVFDADGEINSESLRKIREQMWSSQEALRSASGGTDADRMSVEICRSLLEVQQRRADYQRRIKATREKKYPSLIGADPEVKRKRFLDAIDNQWRQYKGQQQEYCSELLFRMKKAS